MSAYLASIRRFYEEAAGTAAAADSSDPSDDELSSEHDAGLSEDDYDDAAAGGGEAGAAAEDGFEASDDDIGESEDEDDGFGFGDEEALTTRKEEQASAPPTRDGEAPKQKPQEVTADAGADAGTQQPPPQPPQPQPPQQPQQQEQEQPKMMPTLPTARAPPSAGGEPRQQSGPPPGPPRPAAAQQQVSAPEPQAPQLPKGHDDDPNNPRLKELRTYMRDLRVTWMRIASRLGKNDRHSVVAQVLYRINLAEERIADKLARGPNAPPAPRRQPAQPESFRPDASERDDAQKLESAQGEASPLDITITVLLLGKAGTGKTETLRALLADDPNADIPAADPTGDGTAKPYVATGVVKGITLRVIDTPGLRTGSGDASTNQANLRKTKKLTKRYKPDIVLYFDRHDIPSPNVSAEVPLLWAITETFGSSLWYHAILVFTHAASMPPENNGQQIQYDLYKQRRTQISQNLVRQLSGNPGLMNPVSCVENSPKVRRNRAGEACLPDGTAWLPYLLLLISGSALLADANAKLQIWNLRNENEVGYGKLMDGEGAGIRGLLRKFGPRAVVGNVVKRAKAVLMVHDEKTAGGLNPLQRLMRQQQPPPMPFLLSNLITSRKPRKRDEGALERPTAKMIGEMKVIDKAQILKDVREAKEQEELENEEKITVPAPDTPMPPTFDAENLNAHRYRHLEGLQRWSFRPILDQQAYDHEDGVEGVTLDRVYNGVSLPVGGRRRWPCSLSGQLQKDKKSYSLTLDGESTSHFTQDGNKGKFSTTSGFDLQTVGDKEMLKTIRIDGRYKVLQGLKLGVGSNMCNLRGQNYGYKAEARVRPFSFAKVNVAAGVMKSKVEKIPDAHGMNVELLLRSPTPQATGEDESRTKDNPFQLAVSASFMKWRNEVAKGINVNGQMLASTLLPEDFVGDTLVGARFNLNSRSTGQLTLRLSSQESIKPLGWTSGLPLLIALWGRITDP